MRLIESLCSNVCDVDVVENKHVVRLIESLCSNVFDVHGIFNVETCFVDRLMLPAMQVEIYFPAILP